MERALKETKSHVQIKDNSLQFGYGEKNYGGLYPRLQRAHASGVSSEAIPPWSSRSLRDFMVSSIVISTKINSLFRW